MRKKDGKMKISSVEKNVIQINTDGIVREKTKKSLE